MPLVNIDVGGFESGVKHSATVRLQSPNSLDVEVTADGAKSVLDLLKEVTAELANVELPDPLPAEWTELALIPTNGIIVTVSVGILVQYADQT